MRSIPETNEQLIEKLKNEGNLLSKRVIEALRSVDRVDFVPSDAVEVAYLDQPLLLDEDQTISQPTTVAILLELLAVEKGNAVLDIGAGSGWVTCLLAHLAGDDGHVDAYEIRESVSKIGLENISKYPQYRNINYLNSSSANEYGNSKKYERIISGAAFSCIPKELKKLLKIGGIMVIPFNNTLVRIMRVGENSYMRKYIGAFRFVKFVE